MNDDEGGVTDERQTVEEDEQDHPSSVHGYFRGPSRTLHRRVGHPAMLPLTHFSHVA